MIHADQLTDLEDLIEVHVPRHVAGVDVKQHHLGDTPMSPPFLDVWCSCGWEGPHLSVSSDGRPVDLDNISAEVLEEAARSWRFHVRLSNRLHRTDKRLRRQAEAHEEEE